MRVASSDISFNSDFDILRCPPQLEALNSLSESGLWEKRETISIGL